MRRVTEATAKVIEEAMQAVADNMRGTMADYEAVCIKQTPILEYIKITTNTNTSGND